MIAWQPFIGQPRYQLAQAPAAPAVPPAPPAPPVQPPAKRPSLPVLLSAGAISGAILGLGLSFVLPMFSKERMDAGKRTYAAVGGAIGGIGGMFTATAFMD